MAEAKDDMTATMAKQARHMIDVLEAKAGERLTLIVRIADLREALRFYADPANWSRIDDKSKAVEDRGYRARGAIDDDILMDPPAAADASAWTGRAGQMSAGVGTTVQSRTAPYVPWDKYDRLERRYKSLALSADGRIASLTHANQVLTAQAIERDADLAMNGQLLDRHVAEIRRLHNELEARHINEAVLSRVSGVAGEPRRSYGRATGDDRIKEAAETAKAHATPLRRIKVRIVPGVWPKLPPGTWATVHEEWRVASDGTSSTWMTFEEMIPPQSEHGDHEAVVGTANAPGAARAQAGDAVPTPRSDIPPDEVTRYGRTDEAICPPEGEWAVGEIHSELDAPGIWAVTFVAPGASILAVRKVSLVDSVDGS